MKWVCSWRRKSYAWIGAFFLWMLSTGTAPGQPPLPGFATGPSLLPAGPARGDSTAKLSPELSALYQQYAGTREEKPGAWFTEKELRERFGIRSDDKNPSVAVSITVAAPADTKALQRAGAAIRFQEGDLVFATVPVLRLKDLADVRFVRAIALIPIKHIPQPPLAQERPTLARAGPSREEHLLNAFDRQGLTGKGVLVGIIDTGIDWRHPDFIKPDGSSRIVALWDMYDPSWAKTGGKVGTKPPLEDKATGKPLGTLYTGDQITAALRGQGTVNSVDRFGHGTACAGVAAGNGRATANGVPAGTYTGVAPEADLIIVKAAPPDVEAQGGIGPYTSEAARWMLEQAQARHQPIVINMSFGHHDSAHDGSDAEELNLDQLLGKGKPGQAVCASAGNEGRNTFHAGGTFGPVREGQQDIDSLPTELFVKRNTLLTAYFNHADDWLLALTRTDKPWADAQHHPIFLLLFRDAKGDLQAKLSAKPQDIGVIRQAVHRPAVESPLAHDPPTDRLSLWLEAGSYLIFGSGNSAKVSSGQFDLYLPFPDEASFGKGALASALIGTPGNASSVITVGSYDFRNSWENVKGSHTYFNLKPGALSYYSSPGFRRDGMVKPEVIAPARYTISSAARDCILLKEMGKDYFATKDGLHLAWQGTSAASPYVAGIIALMFQKDPTLDASQIRDILRRTATHDEFTGETPNPRWGYGKLDAAAALKAVGATAQSAENPAAK
ncbi:MAG TPA: S8 family serine peptidase [Chthonomonadaceae bacterium]|nr:S8 family serine peptidase [Chthonomonadaceae bacterium]